MEALPGVAPEKHLDHRPMWREEGAFLVHDVQLAFPKEREGYVHKRRETAVGSNFGAEGWRPTVTCSHLHVLLFLGLAPL